MNNRALFTALLLLLPLTFAAVQPVDYSSSRMLKWEFKTNDFIDSSPGIGEGILLVGSADKHLYAFDLLTGFEKWRFKTDGFIESSPCFYNGIAYVGSNDNNTYAVNATNGQLLWQFNTGGKAYSSPAVASGTLYFGSADGRIYALDAATGILRWNYTTGNAVYSAPTITAGITYVGSNDGSLYALNASTGEKIWSYATLGPIYSSPKVFNNIVYFGSYDKSVYALDAFNGTILWSFPTGDKVLSSPVVERGIVWIGSTDGKVYAINAFNGGELWSFDANVSIESSPYFSARNNAVYFGANDNRVYALNAVTGQKIWAYETGNWVTSSPVVYGNLVYFGSYDRRVYAISTISSVITFPESGQDVNGSVLTIRGVAAADAGVKEVQVQIGDDSTWRTATGTDSWTYSWGIGSLAQGSYRIRVRTTDSNNELEVEPLRTVSISIRQKNTSFSRPLVIEYKKTLRPGDFISITVKDTEGNLVQFARVDIEGAIYYDSEGDGVIDQDQDGMPLVVNKTSGEITFTVTKEGYYVPQGQRLAIAIYTEDNVSIYIAGGAAVVVLAVAAYIWKKRQEPGYT